MNIQRVSEYHKYGENFSGKLVVVDYTEDMRNDPKFGVWNSGSFFDYVEKAEKAVNDKYGKPIRVLLAIPEYVCEIA